MNPNPKMAWNADRLDIRAFAQAGAHLHTEDALSRFERLLAEVHPENAVQARTLRVHGQAHGEMRPSAQGAAPAVWLHLQAQAQIPLTCQRCLGPVDTELKVERWFRFVADEATAEAEDDDCEEDLLALEPRPNLHELLEDELLMELPQVPMHGQCPVPVVMQAADPGMAADGDEPERIHPFAGLAHLKKSAKFQP